MFDQASNINETALNRAPISSGRYRILYQSRTYITDDISAVVDRLAPATESKKPTTFTVFFIGDPKQAQLACTAPPTVLSGGTT